MESTEHLTYERDGATAIVTMNRPEAKNALSLPMLVGMADAWEEIDGNDDIRCAILTGAGGTFCAGMDLKAMGGVDAEKYQPRHAGRPRSALEGTAAPLRREEAAHRRGRGLGGGRRHRDPPGHRHPGGRAPAPSSASSRPGAASSPWAGRPCGLRRQIPYTVAMDLLLTAREVPAEEALRIGLIGHVVPDGTALDKALEIAAVIGQNGPLAVEAIKRSVRETEGMSEVDGLARELELGWPIFSSKDAAEGQKAFAEKRPANFTRL